MSAMALVRGLVDDWLVNAEKEGTISKGFVKKLVFKLLNLFVMSPDFQMGV